MGLEVFLSRRRLNLTRLCEALTPTVPLKQGASGVYTLYFMDVCAMISSPTPQRVPVELPNGTVEYIFLQPYLSALYIHFKREVKHEPIWFCEGLPFHERPFFATKIRELCNLYPILLGTTSAELDTQASFISVQWLVVRSSIDTHMLDFILTSQGSCVCNCGVDSVSHPAPTVRPSGYKDAEVITYTRQPLSTEPSASIEAGFTVDPGPSITTHASQLTTYQNSLVELYETTASDCSYSTLRQNKNYHDPIDILDEAITQGREISCCLHCGFPILPGFLSNRRGMTSFLTSFNFRYAPPGASLAPSGTIDSFLLSRLIDSPAISVRSPPRGVASSVKIDDFDSMFASNVFITSLQAMLPPPLTLLLDTKAELAEFDASAVALENSTVITINKLQQKSCLSRRSRDLVNHRKSNSGISISHHIRKASTMVSLSNNASLCVHQGVESFTNASIEEDPIQSPCNLSCSDTTPIKTMFADTKVDHIREPNADLHGGQNHARNVLKQGPIGRQTLDVAATDKKPDGCSKPGKVVGVNPFTQQWLESDRISPVGRSQQRKTSLKISSYNNQTVMISSSDIANKPLQIPSGPLASSKKSVPRSTSVESKESLLSGVSSGIRIAAKLSTDSKLSQRKTVDLVIRDVTNNSSLAQDSQVDSIIHNEQNDSFLVFTNDKIQSTSASASSSTKKPFRIRQKVDLNGYVPITTKGKVEAVTINLHRMDTSPIRPRSPVRSSFNEEPSQDSIIHGAHPLESIGGDSCSMSGLEDSDEAVSPSNLNSINGKQPRSQASRRDCQEFIKTPSINTLVPLSTTTSTPVEPRGVATASLSILTALRAYHIVTTRKRLIKSKLRNIGPNILEPALASQLYKSSHYTHLVFRWCLISEDFIHYTGSIRRQRRITTLNPMYENYKWTKDSLGFHNVTMYLMSMLMRDILDCISLPDKSNKGRLVLHRSKGGASKDAEVDQEASTEDLVTPDAPSLLNSADISLTEFVINGFKKLLASIAKLSDIFKYRSPDDNMNEPCDNETALGTVDKHATLLLARKQPQKYKKKPSIQVSPKPVASPSYYGLYNLRRIVSQMCRYLYRHADVDVSDPYTILNELDSPIFKSLSTRQQSYLSHNLQRSSAISLQHTHISLFIESELDVQQDIDTCIDNWLSPNQSQTSENSKFEPLICDNNYDINTNIPALAVYHSFNSVFWSSIIRSDHLKDHLLPRNQLFQTIIIKSTSRKSFEPIRTNSLGTTAASSTQDLEGINNSSTMGSYSLNVPLDIWKDSQISDRTFHDLSDGCLINVIPERPVVHRSQALKVTDDGNLAIRQQPHHELGDLLTKMSAHMDQSAPTIGSTDSSAYTTGPTASKPLFLSSPSLTDLPLYKLLIPDEAADLNLSYKIFGAGLVNERLILNTYFYTNRFFIPQPNRLAMFNILAISGGLFMSRDERLSMETIMRETLACLHLTYYDLDYYYYT
ncbi:Hypothetical protein GLP15_3 [Giardia lamblia P15]|uniref:Uncharacterized protein n=1 Tax=Giardia intestinalis (strain P15) TaxID=658858 RepID=E1EWG2_GIAIA|nr:Hypothetical protein GLP15_3 [Giardia lamblia P15]